METELKTVFKKDLIKISDAEVLKIAQAFHFKKVDKNTTILSMGEHHVPFYFVKTGLLRCFDIVQDRERTFDFIQNNTLGTILSSFIAQTPSVAYIEALENTEYAWISYADFWRLFEEIPSLCCWYSGFLEKIFVTCSDRFSTYHNQFLSLKQRYQYFLEDPFFSNALKMRLSDKIIASFLYVAPETLSRLKHKV
jgi:hypothetical protein